MLQEPIKNFARSKQVPGAKLGLTNHSRQLNSSKCLPSDLDECTRIEQSFDRAILHLTFFIFVFF